MVVPGLPSGQQAYMSNVLLQKSPSKGRDRESQGSDAAGTDQTLLSQHL